MANKTPVWFDAGFGVYSGDDTIHHNYTEATGNVITLERGGYGNEVLQVLNAGELKIKSLDTFTESALTVDAYGTQGALTLNDAHDSDHLLTVNKAANGSGWVTEFKLRDSGNQTNDDIALRLIHDVKNNTPLSGADILSMGYTDALEAYQELFRFKQSGDFYMVGGSDADILWNSDGAGKIGNLANYRPDEIHSKTLVTGGGTTIQAQSLKLGPTAVNTKVITALQTGSDDPGIRYNSSSSEWELAHDGTTWVKINTGDGNDLDEAYDAFGGAGSVTIDNGHLDWICTSPYRFGIADSGGPSYFKVDASNGSVTLSSRSSSTASLILQSLGTSSTIDVDSAGQITIDSSTGGISIGASAASDFTTNANLTIESQNNTLYTKGANWIHSSNSTSGDITISSGTLPAAVLTITGGGGANLIQAYQTGGGSLTLQSDLTLNAAATLQAGGLATVRGYRGVSIAVTNNSYDITLSVPNYSTSEIFFNAHGSGNIAFNSVADPTPTTTAQSIIGAINELDSGLGAITWDDIYDNDQSLTIDGTPLTFTQTSTTGIGFGVARNQSAANTDSPIVKIRNYATAAIDDQPALQCLYEDNAGMAGDNVKTIEGAFTSVAGVTGGNVKVFNTLLSLNAGDTGGTLYGYFADGSTTGSWTSYGFYADTDWTYGLYSAAKSHVEDSLSGTESINILNAVVTASAARTSGDAINYRAQLIPHASDTSDASYYGFYGVGSATGSGRKYAFFSDENWSYGLYSNAQVYAKDTLSGSESITVVDSIVEASAQRTSGDAIAHRAIINPNASDLATAYYYGFHAQGSVTGSAIKRAFYADANWSYGLYSLAPVSVNNIGISGAGWTISSIVGSTNGLNGTLYGQIISLSESATDTGAIRGLSLNLTPDGSATNTTYGLYADADWDYGIYSDSKIHTQLLSQSASANVYNAVVTANGITGTIIGYNFLLSESATDSGGIYGAYFDITPDVSASNTKRALYVTSDWDYGIYSASPGIFQQTLTSSSAFEQFSIHLTSGGNTGNEVALLDISLTGNVGDSGPTYYGINLAAASISSGSAIGVHVDSDWTYGLYSHSKSLVSVATIPAGEKCFEVIAGTLAAGSIGLAVDATSVGLTSSGLAAMEVSLTGSASDTAGYLNGIVVSYTDGGGTPDATRGIYIGATWDYGIYSGSKIYVASDAPSGIGATGHWSVCSRVDPATSLASNDEVAAYYADLRDNVSDDSSAIYYGLYIETTDLGAANKRGIFVDTTWPADQYATMIYSGIHYWEEDFGSVVGNTTFVNFTLSGLLNSSIEGRCLNLELFPDVNQSDGSSWYGVRAYMGNANANDTVGSFAFRANANWHYGLYVDNNLSIQQAPNEGTVHVESLSSSAITSSNYYGYSYYHTRHASDTAGELHSFYAQANNAVLLGSGLVIYGFEAGNKCNIGMLSKAETNLFQRVNAEWTSTTTPVVYIDNANTSNDTAALCVASAATGAASKCLEISHSYAGGNTEDTRRALVFTSAQTNRRASNIYTWTPAGSSATTNDWYLYHATPGASQPSSYWLPATTSGEESLLAPIVVPHNSILQTVVIYIYLAGTAPAAGSRVKAHLYEKAYSQQVTNVRIATGEVGTGTGVQTITLSSIAHTIDNRYNSYFIEIENASASGYSTVRAYGIYYVYDVTDFAAACGY